MRTKKIKTQTVQLFSPNIQALHNQIKESKSIQDISFELIDKINKLFEIFDISVFSVYFGLDDIKRKRLGYIFGFRK